LGEREKKKVLIVLLYRGLSGNPRRDGGVACLFKKKPFARGRGTYRAGERLCLRTNPIGGPSGERMGDRIKIQNSLHRGEACRLPLDGEL